MMKPIVSMLFVLAAALLLSSPVQAGYADGMNQYAGYHVMHGGVDPTGTEIVTTCDISGWIRESVRVDSFSTEAMDNDQYRYYGDASFEESWIDSEIVGKMIRSPLVFTIKGDDASSCIESLEAHIEVRTEAVRIAERMAKTNFSTTPGSAPVFVGTADDAANRPDWVTNQADIWSRRTRFHKENHIYKNPDQWAMPCSTCINFVMSRTPGEISVAYESNVWIPGDRGYIYNLDHVGYGLEGASTNTDGHEGENIMYLGNDRYFGLIEFRDPKGNIKSQQGWTDYWVNDLGGKPEWSLMRQFPKTGIESIEGKDYTRRPFNPDAR